ncbi:hypothetical protein [Thalassospira mesophila]|uniref:Uncharacterized protein n=1 Tax=Thalassospira mesophila TaxID=1293891 RepID=A0A1Y2KX10_9PROT|nr:hypothetical protein [Thalassospira mesophila]OSQ36743.1 hypothetical protein TMES_16835 [Thalassospira mesophila]
MNLAFKIGLALFLVLGSAIAMTTVLNFLRFDQTLHHLLAQRLTVVLSETQRDIVSGLDLGLRIENMENLDAMLGRRLGMSSDIQAIQVLDCNGSVIESRTPPGLSASVATIPFTPAPEDQWQSFDGNRAIAGTLLRDSVGQCAGYIRLIADISEATAKLSHASTKMWQAALFGMGAIIPVLIVLFILMRRRHRVFVELNEDFERALDGQPPRVPAHDGDVLTAGEMSMISLYRDMRDQLSKTSPNETSASDADSSFVDDQDHKGKNA